MFAPTTSTHAPKKRTPRRARKHPAKRERAGSARRQRPRPWAGPRSSSLPATDSSARRRTRCSRWPYLWSQEATPHGRPPSTARRSTSSPRARWSSSAPARAGSTPSALSRTRRRRIGRCRRACPRRRMRPSTPTRSSRLRVSGKVTPSSGGPGTAPWSPSCSEKRPSASSSSTRTARRWPTSASASSAPTSAETASAFASETRPRSSCRRTSLALSSTRTLAPNRSSRSPLRCAPTEASPSCHLRCARNSDAFTTRDRRTPRRRWRRRATSS